MVKMSEINNNCLFWVLFALGVGMISFVWWLVTV